jgi:hypothetical protein
MNKIRLLTFFLFFVCRDVLHKFTVDLPKKHGRGGQSALRFARLRSVVLICYLALQ